MIRLKAVFAIAMSVAMAAAAMAARAQHEHHGHHHVGAATDAPIAVDAPPLEILMPQDGDTVGSQVGVIFNTPGDLDEMTMSAAKIGVHLHVDLEGLSLMPTRQQLIDLGGNRYLFLFDLPARPGRNTIKVYWSDALHRTIESTVRSVTVTVKP